MRDKRSVDELSVEELERILAIKKRQERQKRLQRMQQDGRVIDMPPEKPAAAPPVPVQPAKPESSAALPARTIHLAPESVSRKISEPHFDEDVEKDTFKPKKPTSDLIWRKFVDRSLILVEVAAVFGLVIMGVVLLQGIGTLQSETAQAQAFAEEQRRAGIPTIAPTPQLRLVQFVLPGGHTPPNEAGASQFNYDEVPVHLRGLVQDQILNPIIERPPQTDETPLRVIIPAIGVDHTIVQGVDWTALSQGVGQLTNGATPSDDTTNVVLAAHNDIFGEIFRHLDQLEPGQQFQIHTRTRIYNYTITGKEVVSPDAVHVMEHQGRPTATLISCYPYQDNRQRIIIFADRTEL